MSKRNEIAPYESYKDIFNAVQTRGIFRDSKVFADAIPKQKISEIVSAYEACSQNESFDLKQFILQYFALPKEREISYQEDKERPIREHIENLWDVLVTKGETDSDDPTLLSLPEPYIVPGGRFREIYYWDSYFTLLGQVADGRVDMLRSMVNNFAYLIDYLGFIPNGNRYYFCSRSQPPFFSLMVEMLAESTHDPSVYTKYLPELEAEYQFWMEGSETLVNKGDACRRVVKAEKGFLNRYWDEDNSPRPESYREDIELEAQCGSANQELFRDVRAACESGWDFTSRWFGDQNSIETIRTTKIIPIDLNVLMCEMELNLATCYQLKGDRKNENFYRERYVTRRDNIQHLFFDKKSGFFVDLVLPALSFSSVASVAGVFPLFFKLANKEQAESVANILHSQFLKAGGWVTTLGHTGEQWDSPNGWAPLQWCTYKGLLNYGFDDYAKEGARRWVENNISVYQQTGKLLEKYNVEIPGVLAEGGEYVVQHGFGWTNGVLWALMDELGLD